MRSSIILFLVLNISFATANYAIPHQSDLSILNSTDQCGSKSTILSILYGVVDFVPHLIIVPLLIFFNINLASGTGHSILFFYQVLPLAKFHLLLNNHSLAKVLSIGTECLSYNTIPWEEIVYRHSDTGKADFERKLVLAGILRVGLILLYLLFLWVLIRRQTCPLYCCTDKWARGRRYMRNIREYYHQDKSALIGTCSVLVICYGYSVQVSFRLVRMSEMWLCSRSGGDNYTATYNDSYDDVFCEKMEEDCTSLGSMCFLLGTATVVMLSLFPLILLYYPNLHNVLSRITQRITNKSLPRYAKLDPVFDIFQGCYKLHLYFHAGILMAYRMILWSCIVIKGTLQTSQYVITILFLSLLLVQALLRPFQEAKHNNIEVANLLALVLLSSLTGYVTEEHQRLEHLGTLFVACTIVISLIPLVLVICYAIFRIKNWIHKRCRGYESLDGYETEDNLPEHFTQSIITVKESFN